jgi:hypothetical protein
VFALVIFEENNSNYENHHNYNTNPKIPQICESVTTFVITTAVFVTFTESKLTIKCQCIIGQKAGKEYDTAQESHEYNA